jgi:hypothetical protein
VPTPAVSNSAVADPRPPVDYKRERVAAVRDEIGYGIDLAFDCHTLRRSSGRVLQSSTVRSYQRRW